MRKKYPKIYHENADTSVEFNRNKDYLYYQSSNENTHATNSPWYAFELIETTSSDKEILLDANNENLKKEVSQLFKKRKNTSTKDFILN